jgi:hypothetical protein
VGGRYEVRFWVKDDETQNYNTVYTNSWLRFIALRLSKKCIYYKVYLR